MKDSHFKTPRTLREAFGEDTRLGDKFRSGLEWAGILLIGVLIGLMLGYRG
jgi:hypothetical protein